MALLGDLLFPDPAIHTYFTEESRDGRLDVETTYDAIEITMKGKAADYDRMVDILRAALVTTQLTQADVAKARDAKLAVLKSAKPSSRQFADQLIATRLLGDFPYAHPIDGTIESVSRIERPDLMLADDRFLNPNNATLAIVGGVDERVAMRALRQLLGAWRKSDEIIPATFRQPGPPDERTLIANGSDTQTAEIRVAVRGLARSDPDFYAASGLTAVVASRWQKLQPELTRDKFFVRLDSHVLPGLFVLGASVDPAMANKTLESAKTALKSLVDSPLSPDELQAAKSAFSATTKADPADALATAWLDIDTFGLPALSEQNHSRSVVSAADFQRVAARLLRNTPITSVAVGDSERLKTGLAQPQKIQLLEDLNKPKEPEQPNNNASPNQNYRRTAPLIQIKKTNPPATAPKPSGKPD